MNHRAERARIVRFVDQGGASYGRVDSSDSVSILDRAPWLGGKATGRQLSLADCDLLAPVEPTKIVCVGRNYAAHAKELGNQVPTEPLIFLKPPSSVVGPGAPIVLPPISSDVQHEAELALVIGTRCKDVTAADALSYVAGITCLNDVTARDIQRAEIQLARSKGFDSFCPIGPWIVEGAGDLGDLEIRCRVDGELRQDGNTRDMIHDPAALIAFISRVMTLEAGDVIATGTPAGVASLAAGQVVEVEIQGIGTLTNQVVAERRP